MKRLQKATAGAPLLASGLALLALAGPARADPNDYVLDLDFTAGERELEAKIGSASRVPDGTRAASAAALAWGAGVNDYWFTELYVQLASAGVNPGNDGGGLDGFSWESVVRLAEPGQWPVDVGAAIEIERPRAGSQGVKFSVGPMLQKDFDQVQVNFNLLFTRVVDSDQSPGTQIGYQFQVRYRSDPVLDFGMQALGDMGTWNHWGTPSGQSHRIGPALFGRYRLGPGRNIGYNAALLAGMSHGAPDATFRAQIDLEY